MRLRLTMLAVLSSLYGATAYGQAFELNRFHPAPLPSDGFSVNGAQVPGHLGFNLALHADYAHQPLIVGLATGDEYAVVNHQLALHLGLALGLGERGMVYGVLPVNALMRGNDPPSGIVTRLPRPERGGFGDARLGARVRIVGDEDSRATFAAQVALAVPLASVNGDQLYSGDDMVQVEPQLLLDLHFGKATFRLNLGARVREDEALLNTRVSDELTFAAGAQVAFTERWRAVADLYGASSFKDFGSSLERPLEALFGGKYQHPDGFHAALAAGPGLVHGLGTPDVRAIATLGYARIKRREEPAQQAQETAPVDRDGDRIPDTSDACPDVAEDLDGEQDADGCPDEEQAPPPEAAAPPAAAPQDSDGDGVADPDDACPNEPGDASAQGCPEHVVRAKQNIQEILGRVHFASGHDQPEPGSIPTLRAVQKALEENPSITNIRVEGHTDADGDETYNLNLSKRRARTIARWLRERGMAMDRFEFVACGERRSESKPDVVKKSERRVEIRADDAADGGCVPAL